MENLQRKLREEAAKLLSEGRVQALVGFEEGPSPLTAVPVVITRAEEAGKLVLNPLCGQNLAKYVHDLISENRAANARVKPEERKKYAVGVVAPGCATRSLVIHVNERQYDRGEIVVLGLPCTGMADRRKLLAAAGAEEIVHGEFAGDRFKITARGVTKEVALKDVISDWCAVCRYNNPVICDVALGPEAPAFNPDKEYAEVDAFEALSEEERWSYFAAEMGKCMRCNACRNACPSCYCRSCFVEQTQPQWDGIGQSASDVQLFQFMRMYHMVGRCVDCGSCSAVCPMGVDLRRFLKKIEKDGRVLFGNTVGVALGEPALLATAREDDPEEFIYNP